MNFGGLWITFLFSFNRLEGDLWITLVGPRIKYIMLNWAAGGRSFSVLQNLQASVVFVFYLGNSVALTLVPLLFL